MTLSILPLVAVLLCGLSGSAFDLMRKLLVRQLGPLPMVFLIATASVPLFGFMVLLGGGARVAAGYFAPALGSVLLNLIANLTFLQSVRLAPLSHTVPLLSLTPVFTTLLGVPLLGERPPARAALGILLVVTGAVALGMPAPARGGAAASPAPRSARSILLQPASWLMIATALLLSVTLPLDKQAVRQASPPFHGLFLTAGIAAGTLLILVLTSRLGDLAGIKGNWRAFFLALLTSTLALGFQLMALTAVLVGVVETLKRGIGNVMAMVLGRVFFGEAITSRKLAAVALMAAGVGLILL